MPAMSSIMRWLFDTHPEGDPRLEFREHYARAREVQLRGFGSPSPTGAALVPFEAGSDIRTKSDQRRPHRRLAKPRTTEPIYMRLQLVAWRWNMPRGGTAFAHRSTVSYGI